MRTTRAVSNLDRGPIHFCYRICRFAHTIHLRYHRAFCFVSVSYLTVCSQTDNEHLKLGMRTDTGCTGDAAVGVERAVGYVSTSHTGRERPAQ